MGIQSSIATDFPTIIICVILLIVAFVAPLLSPFFRKKGIMQELHNDDADNKKSSEAESQLYPITVVITTHDNSDDLQRNLPLFLRQDYPAGFRVIVVADETDSNTIDVLKRFATGNGHFNESTIEGNESVKISSVNTQLYYILLPSSSRYMSRKKLGVTLGVKAAKTEWVLLTDPFCHPVGDQWLKEMAKKAEEKRNLVMGYTCYTEDAPDYMRFLRLHTDFYLMRQALKGTAYRAQGSNLMFRKTEFLNCEGYRGNLELIRGEYDFIVNKYAKEGGTALQLNPEAWMIEDVPEKKAWRNKYLFTLANLHKLQRRTAVHLLYLLDQAALHLILWALIATAVISGCMEQWLVVGTAVLALIVNVGINTLICKSAIKEFDTQIPAYKLYVFQLRVFWTRLFMRLLYWKANKLDFTTHKQ